MKLPCKVSIICITYNQGKYIGEALESMLMQEASFDYEIIVHDDHSTDQTREILQEYASIHSEKIRVLYEKENQYSKNVDFFAPIVKNLAKGKYIAVCEGDDFWLDKRKIQIQYEALEEYPECDMCACWGCTTTEDGKKEISQIRPLTKDGILWPAEVILGGGQYLVTAGLFFRRSMYEKMMPFERVVPLDYAQQIKGALRGGIYYIDKKMAAYRRYADGSWTNHVLKNEEKLGLQWEKEIELLKTLDRDTSRKYHEAICKRLAMYVTFEAQLACRRKDILPLLERLGGNFYIWGMGRRGRSLEKFLHGENVPIAGVCDLVNCHVGQKTLYGNRIFHTDDVLQQGGTILVSTRYAYEDLRKMNFPGRMVDFQQYMPLG